MKSRIGNVRVMGLGVMAWALFAMSAGLYANQQNDHSTHDGTLVSVTGNGFVMKGLDGQEHSHTLAEDAKLTLDGKDCPLADLEPGTRIRVTTRGADSTTALRIEAIDKNSEFASHWHDGKFVSLTGDRLVMAHKDDHQDGHKDGEEHTFSLMDNAKMTLDGDACQRADIEPGVRIRVFTQDAFSQVATRIEAIDNDQEFASNRHDGKVVSAARNQMVMICEDKAEEHSLSLANGAILTLDGNTIRVTDLKPETRVRVTTRDAFSTVVTRVEAIDQNREFASDVRDGDYHDGVIVSITRNRLVMTDMDGNDEHTCALSPDVKITLDAKDVAFSDLRPGMRIRVSSQGDDPNVATRIEAIDQNREFASTVGPRSND